MSRDLLDEFDRNEVPNESPASQAARLRVLAARLTEQHRELKEAARAAVRDARECRAAAAEARAWHDRIVMDPSYRIPLPSRRRSTPAPRMDATMPDDSTDEFTAIVRRLRTGDRALAHQLLGPEGRAFTERLYRDEQVAELFRPRRVTLVREGRPVTVSRGGFGALRERLVREARAALRRSG